MKVALVVMPFAAADRPSLAAGLLKASLARRDIQCDVKYFNLTFWRMLGHEPYSWFAEKAPLTSLPGEWVFSQALFGERFSCWDAYQAEVLSDPVWGLTAKDRLRLPEALALIPSFLTVAYASCDWSRYDVVGFTSAFQQTMASLALARRIRAAHRATVLVAGGSNFEGPMGRPYLEALDILDYVSTGEAEHGFPELCERLRTGRKDPPAGFLYREGSTVCEGRHAERPDSINDLPVPDYDDFFRVLRSTDRARQVVPWLQVEASRGCWWGQASQCTFCGLNGGATSFRSKDWRKVVGEVDGLLARHGR